MSTIASMRDRRVRGLYAITPDRSDTDRLVAMVDAALAGGASIVQYRNKIADVGLRELQATALARVCARHGRPLIVNDHVDLALKLPHAGLHVGADDATDLATLRAQLGADRLLGVSCYDDLSRARVAVAAGADYVAFGSVFASTTKPAAVGAALDLFAGARDLGVPLVGIGGITLQNLPRLRAAGADAAAIIDALFGVDDLPTIRARALALSTALEGSLAP